MVCFYEVIFPMKKYPLKHYIGTRPRNTTLVRTWQTGKQIAITGPVFQKYKADVSRPGSGSKKLSLSLKTPSHQSQVQFGRKYVTSTFLYLLVLLDSDADVVI